MKSNSNLANERIRYETTQASIKELINIGYSYQQACDWLRKMNIQSLFEKDQRVQNDD